MPLVQPSGRFGLHAARGFTLIEVMIVLAIGAITVAMAAPSLLATIRANRVEAAASDLRAATQLARSEAIKRAAIVVVEPTTAGAWARGVRVYVDNDLNPSNAFTGNDLLVRQNTMLNNVTVAANAPVRLAFDGRGRNVVLAAAMANQLPTTSTLTLCSATVGRQLTINPAGHAQQTATTC